MLIKLLLTIQGRSRWFATALPQDHLGENPVGYSAGGICMHFITTSRVPVRYARLMLGNDFRDDEHGESTRAPQNAEQVTHRVDHGREHEEDNSLRNQV
jgi:hypothetical protein